MKFTFSITVLIISIFAPLAGLAQNGGLITAFTNPAPTSFGNFGWSAAAVGSDRVLIGAPGNTTGLDNRGVVYLFSTNGALLTTFTNPLPQTGDFGRSVAVGGGGLVLIDRHSFNTNGVLLTTFTNPTPASVFGFGSSIAAVGSDRVLIGAEGYDFGVTNSGAAFLFSTNGVLLTTLTNPNPGNHLFGHSVTAALKDKLVVGAPRSDPTQGNSGAAYLFNTNGVLLLAFTNPNPATVDNFGWSVVAVGNDRVLIGALFNYTDGVPAGAACLYSSNGTLLATITTPIPVANAQLGYSLAVVDNDRLLIGAPLEDDWTRAGAAYLFSTNGNRLVTFTNPTTSQFPNQYLGFGSALAAVGRDSVVIGSPSDDTGNMDAGAAYLLSIPPPSLRIQLTATNAAVVSWFSPAPGFTLQQNTNDIATTNWSNVADTIQDDGTNRTFITTPLQGSSFFRLIRP